MLTAKAKTIDNRYSITVSAEDVDKILVELMTWQIENEFMSMQIGGTSVVDENGSALWTVEFEETGVKATPCR